MSRHDKSALCSAYVNYKWVKQNSPYLKNTLHILISNFFPTIPLSNNFFFKLGSLYIWNIYNKIWKNYFSLKIAGIFHTTLSLKSIKLFILKRVNWKTKFLIFWKVNNSDIYKTKQKSYFFKALDKEILWESMDKISGTVLKIFSDVDGITPTHI